jgi:hypothetical protein
MGKASSNKRLRIRPISPNCKGECRLHLDTPTGRVYGTGQRPHSAVCPAGKGRPPLSAMGWQDGEGKPAASPDELQAMIEQITQLYGKPPPAAIANHMLLLASAWALIAGADSKATLLAALRQFTATQLDVFATVGVGLDETMSAILDGAALALKASKVREAQKHTPLQA